MNFDTFKSQVKDNLRKKWARAMHADVIANDLIHKYEDLILYHFNNFEPNEKEAKICTDAISIKEHSLSYPDQYKDKNLDSMFELRLLAKDQVERREKAKLEFELESNFSQSQTYSSLLRKLCKR